MHHPRTSLTIVFVTALAVVAHGACLLWDAGSGGAMARMLRTLLGLYVVMLGPGAVVALCITRRERLGGLAFLSRAWAANAALLIVGTTAMKAAGHALNPWSLYVFVAVSLAASVVWFFLRGRSCEVVLGGRAELHLAAAMLLCPLLIFACRRPLVVSDDSYFPLEMARPLAELCALHHSPGAQFEVTRSHQWRRLGERRFEIDAWPATMQVRNAGPEPATFALKLVVESHLEGVLRIELAGRLVIEQYMHPRFERLIHPRNYPPPNFLIGCRLLLPPGESRLTLAVDAPGEGRVVVTDLSGLGAKASRRVFDRHYLIGYLGDVQSNLSLSRNFSDRVWLFTHSYDGSQFDRGGYTISNLPFPYYIDNLAMLLMGDSPMSLDALYLGLVGVMVAVLLGVAGCWSGEGRARYAWLAFGAMLCYGALMRLHIESLYVHTLLTFCFLLCMYHWLRGERGWFLAYALFVLLTKGGVVLLALALVFGVALMSGQRRRMVVDGALVLAMVLVGLVAFDAAKRANPQLAVWQAEARSDEYAGRFNIVRSLGSHPWARSRPLRLAGGRLTVLVLLASCMLPLQVVRGGDQRVWLLVCVGGAFHLVVCAADPTVVSLAAIQHPLNYFTPAAPLLACAGLRAMSLRRLRPNWLHGAVCALCLAACVYAAKTHDRPWPLPRHAAMHACALTDFLARRAAERLVAGDAESALVDAHRAAAASESHLAEAFVHRVYARALVVQAGALVMLGRNADAAQLIRRALRIHQSAAAAIEGLCELLRFGGHNSTIIAVRQALAAARNVESQNMKHEP